MRQMRGDPNSAAILNNLIQQDPNLQQIVPLLRMSNGDVKGLAQFIANQKGVDLNALINALQS